MPALLGALKDPDAEVREWAAHGLYYQIGKKAKAALPALVDALKDQNAVVRNRAASTLGNIGAEAQSAVPALIDALADQAAEAYGAAAQALAKIGVTAFGAMQPNAEQPSPQRNGGRRGPQSKARLVFLCANSASSVPLR